MTYIKSHVVRYHLDLKAEERKHVCSYDTRIAIYAASVVRLRKAAPQPLACCSERCSRPRLLGAASRTLGHVFHTVTGVVLSYCQYMLAIVWDGLSHLTSVSTI
jgi:hypothetical protein